MNFKPKETPRDEGSLEDEPVPTYEEWLNDGAKQVFGHWGFHIAKGAIELVKYLWTRERLLIELLLQKDIIQQHEVDEFFGDDAHANCAKEGVKQLTRQLMRAASQGKLVGPEGQTVDPDTVLVVLNDILDLNSTGWDGRTLEIASEMFGRENLREDYDKEVKLINQLNKQRAKARQRQKQNAELDRRRCEEREHRVRIYVSQCRVHEKPLPTDDEQRQMVEGKIPIPKVA
jgi:hypothetical protein